VTDAYDTRALADGIAAWAEFETPSNRPKAVDALMRHVQERFAALGAAIECPRPDPDAARIVIARFNAGAPGRRILILGHLDTVHPLGTKDGPLPIRIEDGRLYGPGVLDMKGGNYLAYHALKTLIAERRLPGTPITVMLVPDEERGSPVSRPLIEAEAQRHDCVLVPEPARSGYTVTGRFAFARYGLVTHGRPAHAGADNLAGKSAIRAMARLIEEIESATDMKRLISYSVGIVHGGEFSNVVPLSCRAEVLAVADSAENLAEIHRRMAELRSPIPEVTLSVEPGPVRPLFLPGPGTMALYRLAEGLAADLGLVLKHRVSGGGSDGNFTGALGVPTLDGLGPAGEGPHTHGEHIDLESLAARARLFERLIAAIAADTTDLSLS